jgi:hypothetical protein
MKRSIDPLTAATTTYLWPFLKSVGFKKLSPRKYAREINDTIQQLWVDANGFGGKRRTLFVLCVNAVYGNQSGYMDPCGFRICKSETWDMSTLESADNAMQEVVKALKETELERINSISSIEGIVTSLEGFWRTEWYEQNKYLAERWRKKDPELLELAEKNRKEFKL